MTSEESKPLIDYLCYHATRPENVYRHVWRAGDYFADNRTTMHKALADFLTQTRHMLSDAPLNSLAYRRQLDNRAAQAFHEFVEILLFSLIRPL